MKKYFTYLTLLTIGLTQAQVLIDDTTTPNAAPDASAVIELRSADKGLLVPRLSAAPTGTPVEGLVYFDNVQKCFKGYNGTSWEEIGAACLVAGSTNYSISIANAADVVEGTDQTFTVTISPAVEAGDQVTVYYITNELSPVSATEDTDYTGTIGTLTFNPADTSKTITVSTTDDSIVESNESYTVDLSNAAVTLATNTVSISTPSATGVITDNDVPAPSNSFTETFNDQNISSSTGYSGTYNFTGADNTSWTCVARTSLNGYEIDGNGFMFRDSGSNYCDVTFPNGITTLTFDYRAGFTGSGNRQIDVKNGTTTIGSTGIFPVGTPTTTLSPVINVNETGSVTIRIVQASSKQAVIDNVSWTR